MKPLFAVLGVGLVLAGCGPSSQPSPAEPTPSPTINLFALTQQLAFDLAFFESQGDSGLAIEVALHFEALTGCVTGYSLAYWQEEQRAEEVLARTAAMKEMNLTYSYVAGAVRDAMLPLKYQSSTNPGTWLEADFIGVLVGARCG